MAAQLSMMLPLDGSVSAATADIRGVSKTAAMITAIVDSVPTVGHAKGTHRETIRRPVAYLYARRDGLDPDDRRLVVNICAAVTGRHRDDVATVADVARHAGEVVFYPARIWLRLSGERGRSSPASTAARDPYRSFGSDHPWDPWFLHVASRAPSTWRVPFKQALESVGVDMRGTLAGILLALSWSPDIAVLTRWRREDVMVGDDMRVRADLAESRNELEPSLMERVHRLAALPATVPLMLALADVPGETP